MELSVTTSSKVVDCSTKFCSGKTLGGIPFIGLGRHCFKTSVAANHMKICGVFTEIGLSKVVNKHTLGMVTASKGTI